MLVERKSLLGVQAAAKAKLPTGVSRFARCFAAILPSFLSVRGFTSPLLLDFLGFSSELRLINGLHGKKRGKFSLALFPDVGCTIRVSQVEATRKRQGIFMPQA